MGLLDTSHLQNYAESRAGTITRILSFTISFQYIYNLAFNLTPESMRTAYAGTLLVIFLCLSIYSIISKPETWHRLIYWSMAIVFICWLVSNTLAFGVFDLRQAALDIQVYLLVVFLLTLNDRLPLGTLAFWAIVVILVAAGFALFGEPIIYGGVGSTRPMPITGGIDVIFPSAYFLTANVIILDTLRRFKVVHPRIAWPILLLGLLAIFLYEVRTTWIIVFVYIVGVQLRRSLQLRTQMPLLFAFAMMGLGVFFGLLDFERIVGSPVGSWGSGRVTAFIDRMELLAMRDAGLFLFGTGPGSDVQATSIWWGLRSSHSDILNIFTERGIFGFLSLLIFVIALMFKISLVHGQIILLATLIASSISNGFYSGNGIAFYYFVAMAIAISLELRQQTDAGALEAANLSGSEVSDPTRPG